MAKPKSSKPGASSVMPSARGRNPAGNSGGTPGRSEPQKKIPGPEKTGQPIAMRKALAKKPQRDRGSSFPGLVR